jgi:hypothetical protein
MDSNKTKNSSSITMDLENLRQKYSNLLIKYERAVADYVNYLNIQSQKNSSTSPNNSQQLVSIQGQAFNGTGSAGQSSATTLQECMASCYNSDKCTGATFISNKCQLRTGDSSIVSSSPNSYAIIPKGKQLLLNMEDINQQLLDINKELVRKIKVTEPVYDKINNDSELKNQELIKNYESLLEERRNIEKILNEYETLDNTENDNQIKINKNYYSYNLLLTIAIAAIFILYKMFFSNSVPVQAIQYGGDLGINAYYIVFGLTIFLIIVNFLMKYVTLK